jgi:uncharacterized protein
MILGEFNELIVKRETDISYILTDGDLEIFLHKKEAERPYEDGEKIEVFLYDDNQGRITASTKKPLLELDEAALLEVVSFNYNYGVFLYYGMVKDLLLSLDDLPTNKKLWPRPKDKLWVTMKNKNNRLFGEMISRYKLSLYLPDPEDLVKSQSYDAYVQHLLENGLIAFTEQGHEIFVHHNNYREEVRIGQLLTIKIINKNETGNYSGSLIEQKELMLQTDAQMIYQYLLDHGGNMEYTDKSDADEIYRVFHMSKSAFKRALGHLYHLKKIELSKENTKIRR